MCAQSDLKSFLVEITAIIVNKPDDKGPGYLVDKIVDQTGSKGTGGHFTTENASCAAWPDGFTIRVGFVLACFARR